jgi:hypothetical protein
MVMGCLSCGTVCTEFVLYKNCKAVGMRHEHPVVVCYGRLVVAVGALGAYKGVWRTQVGASGLQGMLLLWWFGC